MLRETEPVLEQPVFIYISLMRTGTRSIRTTLFPDAPTSTDAPCYWNKTALEIREDFDRRGWDWDRAFKFTFVRNPWDRLVSAYHFWRPNDALESSTTRPWRDVIGFEEWVNRRIDRWNEGDQRLFRQRALLVDERGELLLDLVGRFEELDRDWRSIAHRLGVPAQLPRHHRTVHRHYSAYYGDELRRRVSEACAEDIAAFDYRFEEPAAARWAVEGARYRGRWCVERGKEMLRDSAPRVWGLARAVRMRWR